MIDLPAVVSGYAGRMHRELGDAHHVASPLGAWIVLALAASADDGDALSTALGCSRREAVHAASELLSRPHPVLALAAATWHRAGSPVLEAWSRTLGEHVDTGPVPTQAEADQWAERNTSGLIDRFPLAITPATLLVLASAVAASIDWRVAFEVAPSSMARLPRGAGFAGVALLRSPGAVATQLIADTAAGPVAVHAMPSVEGDLLVVSVIGPESAAAADVLAAAHPIAVALAGGADVPGRRSLFDIPLGAGHSWTITEKVGRGIRDTERCDALLPAWHAQSDHDLMAMPSSGFPAAGEVLRRLLDGAGVGGAGADARQSALARYTRTGFEAAAVTAMAMRSAALAPQRQVRTRTALLEFTRPHAVVAVAADPGASPWAALPVFSAWITTGDEPG